MHDHAVLRHRDQRNRIAPRVDLDTTIKSLADTGR